MTKNLARECGIYRISIRLPDGSAKFYIGQTVQISVRWARHLTLLRKGSHWNKALQSDYMRCGPGAVSFEIILICQRDREILALYEQTVVDASDPNLLYNVRVKCVTSGLGTIASQERRMKVAKALTGIKRSEETRAAVGRAQAWKHTPEGRAKMSAAAKGRKATPEQKARRSEAMKLRGALPPESYQKGIATKAMNKAVLERGTAWVLHG